jgi:hypothetical protein
MMHGSTLCAIVQLHARQMQLNFENESFHIRIAPLAQRHKLHIIGRRITLHAGESHFDFQPNAPLASKELLPSNACIEPHLLVT